MRITAAIVPLKLWPILVVMAPGLALVAACKSIQDPWYWLDEPDNQVWVPVTVEAYGRTIEFSIPDSAPALGSNVIATPRLGKTREDNTIVVPLDSFNLPAKNCAAFIWEHYWGGFRWDDVINFQLFVTLIRADDVDKLLDLTVEERMERTRADYYGDFQDNDFGRWKKDLFQIEPYASSQGYRWTLERWGPNPRDNERFKIPITDVHELELSFYYRMNELKPVNDEAWYQRRIKLARQILDSVRITPELNLPGS